MKSNNLNTQNDLFREHLFNLLALYDEKDIITKDDATALIELSKKSFRDYEHHTSTLLNSYATDTKLYAKLHGIFNDLFCTCQEYSIRLDPSVIELFTPVYKQWSKNLINLFADLPELFEFPYYYRTDNDEDESTYYVVYCFREDPLIKREDINLNFSLDYCIDGNAIKKGVSKFTDGINNRGVGGRGYTTTYTYDPGSEELRTQTSSSCERYSCSRNPQTMQLLSAKGNSFRKKIKLCNSEKDACGCTVIHPLYTSIEILWFVWLYVTLDQFKEDSSFTFIYDKIHQEVEDIDPQYGFKVKSWNMNENSTELTENEVTKFIELVTMHGKCIFNKLTSIGMEKINSAQIKANNKADESSVDVPPFYTEFTVEKEEECRNTNMAYLQNMCMSQFIYYYDTDDYSYVRAKVKPQMQKLDEDNVINYYVHYDKFLDEYSFCVEYQTKPYKLKTREECDIFEKYFYDNLLECLQKKQTDL